MRQQGSEVVRWWGDNGNLEGQAGRCSSLDGVNDR
jgi:hypothetical protein